jgi:PST family polysaccharide transporter
MSVSGAAKRGIAWTLSSNLLIQTMSFGVGVVLARLIPPAEFGVFAITGIFSGLAATVSNIGLGSALVRRKEITAAHCRSMLTANLASSGAIVVVLTLVAPWVGRYFKNATAAPVLMVVAWNFLINAVSSVSFSLTSRALRFRLIAQIEAFAAVVNGVVAIVLALRGLGVWAIAWAGIAQSLARAVLLLALGGWRPALGWDGAALRELVGFGAGLTLKRLINYAAANVDYVVIGRRLGAADLGFYTRAYNLMTLPLTQLSRVMMQVLFPAFARIQDDNPRLIAGYSKVVMATALASFPFLVGLFLVAAPFVHVVYGATWMPAVLPLQIMCVAGMMKSVSTFIGSIVDAKGYVGSEVRRQLVYLALLAGGTFAGSFYGTTGVAVAVVVASLAMLVMMQTLLNRLTGMTWRDYFAALAPALGGVLVMSAVVLAFQLAARRFLDPLSPVFLFGAALLGAAAYVLFFLVVRIERVEALRSELVRTFLRRQGGGTEGPAAATMAAAGAASGTAPAREESR